jgi:GH15 family glucan-1,4-alpha-glucosidase
VEKLHSHVIYVDESGARKSEPTGEGPFVGVWWAEGPTVVAILQAASSVRTSLPLIDSEFDHWREWESICQHFNKTQ